jgi:hypothetical protein
MRRDQHVHGLPRIERGHVPRALAGFEQADDAPAAAIENLDDLGFPLPRPALTHDARGDDVSLGRTAEPSRRNEQVGSAFLGNDEPVAIAMELQPPTDQSTADIRGQAVVARAGDDPLPDQLARRAPESWPLVPRNVEPPQHLAQRHRTVVGSFEEFE